MDLDFLNDVKKNSHLFKEDVYFEACPKCQGFSFSNQLCQNCGYSSKVSLIGEALGEKSFYTLKENFYKSLTDFEKNHQNLFREDIKFKHFMNKVKLRYNDLLDFLYSEEAHQSRERSIYLHELRDIVIEMMDAQVDEREIWQPLEEFDQSHGLFTRIREVMAEKKSLRKQTSFFSFDYKFAGVLSMSLLMFIIMVMALFVSLSLAFISYYKFN